MVLSGTDILICTSLFIYPLFIKARQICRSSSLLQVLELERFSYGLPGPQIVYLRVVYIRMSENIFVMLIELQMQHVSPLASHTTLSMNILEP